jgi:hypothetical protein
MRYGNQILRHHQPLGLLLFISMSYAVTLWAWNYHDFIHLGAAVALNGRYLFPIMPPILLAVGLAYQSRLRHYPNLKTGLLVVVLLLFCKAAAP